MLPRCLPYPFPSKSRRSCDTISVTPQAGKDVCSRRKATVKSHHMRRFVNEGNDIDNASEMKSAIESYGWVKGCYGALAEIQEPRQSMTKHSMTGILALNNFLYEPAGLRVWKAYNVGPASYSHLHSLESMVFHRAQQG